MKLMKKINNLWKNKKGQSMTEYILLVSLIAIALIAGWKFFGHKIAELIKNAATEMDDAKSYKPLDEKGNLEK